MNTTRPLAPTWRRFTTTGAIACITSGLVTSIALIVLGPSVWPGRAAAAPYPTLVAVSAGFLACWLGSVLSSECGAARSFDELQVRSQAGLGSEQATVSAH